MATVLILGGTRDARELAGSLPGHTVISSLAGRTTSPLLPPGEVRVGGFGGAEGLASFLRTRRVDVLVDATHPFAARISANAAVAAQVTGVPLLVLQRPGWVPGPGDDWRRVRDLSQAAAELPGLGERVFLTTGRQEMAAFAAVKECWFLARSIEPPEPPMPQRLAVIRDRGPFTLDGERNILKDHRIDVLVTKDSGGPAPKLSAARERGIPVLVVDRPSAPPGTETAATVPEAAATIASWTSSPGR
ncbi:cobalt-precorrin-6A reductase [Actinoplanes sp. TBRC 11911]|uniref:cobalt-precorrin-6A reductase n=1 Tax=Actinoplanes sp. TBRC 11911 TaxID=2729386 RepID=UPI00145D9073|nr:cobalt-precorrin-6A reductase [Actinoplanes sp. TBRC 11911]NMO53297.1 cobalt-precorrin-6A reductase [Actinoplanes sp. TBRC 11911]